VELKKPCGVQPILLIGYDRFKACGERFGRRQVVVVMRLACLSQYHVIFVED
jgi:hypothetical protein